LKIFLAVTGAGAVQGSIKNWCREHRAHHRYTDTDQDPYSVHKGILHAHILWIVLKQPNTVGRVDISDLKRDPIVVWQNTFFVPLALFMGWIFPTLIAGIFWNDWKGGFIYAGILRLFLVHQSTFCVNSLAHYLGDQPFSDRHSSRDHLFTSIVTLGEGYHNFHHEFPSDYRNGIEWHNIDISKWTIWIFDRVGLAWDLKRFGQNEIEKSRIQQLRKMVDRREKKIDWGTPISQLPVFEWREYQERIKEGYLLIAIEGVIYDITHFVKTHPGGESIIRSGIGKDGTALFNGGVYDHSDAARNFLSSMRLAKLRGGCEVEVWK
jgi:stearoyl-CoA desaturase (delta-9 desaturase)